MIKSSIDLNTKINQEVSKSFRNVNYSQWERQSTKQPSQINIKKNGNQIYFEIHTCSSNAQ